MTTGYEPYPKYKVKRAGPINGGYGSIGKHPMKPKIVEIDGEDVSHKNLFRLPHGVEITITENENNFSS